MAREINRLSPTRVKTVNRPGLYADGGGLYLHVGPTGGKSWIYRFMLDGRPHEMGLGPLNTFGLAEARQRAMTCRQQRHDGINPIQAKAQARAARRLDAAKAITFKACAARYIKAHKAGWRNAKHAAQWDSTLEAYAYPVIGSLPVALIDTGLVTRILEPIWAMKPETASRVRGRVEAVLDYARTHGWRTDDNPARWKGHLENVLPKRSKIHVVEHHAALPWREMAGFMRDLIDQQGVGALALRFAILTAARTGEVIGARWSEVDLKEAIWAIPASRMKAARDHRVPLSGPALDVLAAAGRLRDGTDADAFLFPGGKPGRGLSNMALLAVLKRMERGGLTSHGFRSSFRDWASEATTYAGDVSEAALAHVISDKTEAAYRRGDLFEKRRELMRDWCTHCAGTGDLAV